MEQLSLNSDYSVAAKPEKYHHYISTVGDLRKALEHWEDDTLIEMSFVGYLPMGERVNVSMPITNIGNSMKIVDGKKVNLISLDGNDI